MALLLAVEEYYRLYPLHLNHLLLLTLQLLQPPLDGPLLSLPPVQLTPLQTPRHLLPQLLLLPQVLQIQPRTLQLLLQWLHLRQQARIPRALLIPLLPRLLLRLQYQLLLPQLQWDLLLLPLVLRQLSTCTCLRHLLHPLSQVSPQSHPSNLTSLLLLHRPLLR